MFRYTHMIPGFQKIIYHFIIFRCTLSKSMTDNNNTLWRIRLIKLCMKLSGFFSSLRFFRPCNITLSASFPQIWFYFCSHRICKFIFLYNFHILCLYRFSSHFFLLLHSFSNNSINLFLIIKYQYNSANTTKYCCTKSCYTISRAISCANRRYCRKNQH